MNNIEKTEETCDQSRRKLLKKSYTAPVIIALGTMSFSTDSQAMAPKQNSGGGSTSGGSSLSSGSSCNVCHRWPCCCR